jgi:hypothetical protein
MLDSVIDQCAFGTVDHSAARPTMAMQYSVTPVIANQRAVRAMTRVTDSLALHNFAFHLQHICDRRANGRRKVVT